MTRTCDIFHNDFGGFQEPYLRGKQSLYRMKKVNYDDSPPMGGETGAGGGGGE